MCCLPLPFDGKCLKTIYSKIKKELPIKSYVVMFANNWNFTHKKKKKEKIKTKIKTKRKRRRRNEENGKSTPMIEGTHLKFLIIYEKKKKNYY